MKSTRFCVVFIFLFVIGSVAYAQSPEWIWANHGGGIDSDEGFSLALDESGNQYVTGYFSSTASFGSFNLISAGMHDVFIAKYDPAGNCLWAVRGGGSGDDDGYGCAVDTWGNVCVTGSFLGSANFGNSTLIGSNDQDDVFVAKLDTNGNWLWVVSAGAPNNGAYGDEGNAIAISSEGFIYVSGKFNGTALFGVHSIIGYGIHDAFIAKLNPDGTWLWAINAGGSYADYGKGLAVDVTGVVYFTGAFFETAVFGSTTLVSTGQSDVVIAQLTPSGEWVWAVKAGGISYDYGNSIAVDSSRNVYVTGSFQGTGAFGGVSLNSAGSADIFVTKLSYTGDWLWSIRAGAVGADYGLGIDTDSGGNVYVTGRFLNTIYCGATLLTSGGLSDVFIGNLDTLGSWQWALQAGSNQNDIGSSIAVYSENCLYISGVFSTAASFGTNALSGIGQNDMFVAKAGRYTNSPNVPLNISITVQGNDILLTWDPVTQDTLGHPFNPDAYNIYYCPSEPDGEYLFHAQVAANTVEYIIEDAAQIPDRGYFYLTAVKF